MLMKPSPQHESGGEFSKFSHTQVWSLMDWHACNFQVNNWGKASLQEGVHGRERTEESTGGDFYILGPYQWWRDASMQLLPGAETREAVSGISVSP